MKVRATVALVATLASALAVIPRTELHAASAPAPMPVISRGVPAFATNAVYPASQGNDADYDKVFRGTPPTSLTYDLSGVPAANRGRVLVAWYTEAGGWLTKPGESFYDEPRDYTIEGSSAAGGGSPPVGGWVNLVTVTGNVRNSRLHMTDLTGFNWVRMSVTAINGSFQNMDAGFNLDIHDAHLAPDDAWFFLGDSITLLSMTHHEPSNYAQQVNAALPSFFPAQQNAGIGFWKTDDPLQTDPTTGQQYLAEWLAIFPGRFVSIALGTNDALGNAPPSFVSGNLSTMAQQVLNAGKIPVIPLIPWSCDSRIQASGPGINAAIQELWANNPQIVPGPDFWSYFQAHPTQLSDCIHPTVNEGTDAYRKLYADKMLANVYQGAADTQPPTAPSNASATATSSSQITLTWTASTDNVGVTGYQVERCAGAPCSTFAQVASVAASPFNDTGLSPSTSYSYRVRATDAAGNLGPYSNIASATTQAAPPPSSGLMAGYGFDEGSGTTTADASGKGHTGTLQGASWTASGKYGGALSFNGSSSYVDIGNAADLQLTGSMTWSAWIYATANPPDDGQIIAKSNGAGWQFKTTPDTGAHTFGVGISPSAGTITQRYSTTVRALNTWYHVAGVYDATAQTLNVYVNGLLDNGALSGVVPASQYNAAGENVTVGRRAGGFYFQGTIDEVRLYNRALSAAEIQSDMNTPVGGTPPPDTTPPTAPSGLGATAASSSRIDLAWTASTDNVGVTGYQIERCAGATCTSFAQIATATTTTYGDSGLAASTTYRYRVRATDAAGNLSAYSNVASATTQAPPPPPPGGLVAAYGFSEGSGTTTQDASGKGHTGTLQGGASWTASGKYGSALSFNGSTSYVDLGNAADLQLTGSMTWSAWIFASANPGDDGQIIAKSGGAGWQFKTSPDTGVHTFGVGVSPDAGSLTQRYSATVRQLGTWYHVAGVYDAAAQTLNVYVNGVLDNGALVGSVPASQYNSPENVTIGRRAGGFYFAGTIDELRLYNRALSQAEIQSDMNTPVGP